MDLDLYKSELCLTDNAPIRLLSARGVRITCTAGLVWLTVEGEAGDIFLAPGQNFPGAGAESSRSRPWSGFAGSHREWAGSLRQNRPAHLGSPV